MGRKTTRPIFPKVEERVDCSSDESEGVDASDSVETIEPCTVAPEEVDVVRRTMGFDESVVIEIPRAGQSVHDAPEGFLCFYLYPFTAGLRFPFPPLVEEALRHTNLAFTQIMPHAWRVLLTTSAMCVRLGVTIGLGDLALAYKFRSLGHMTYTLRSTDKAMGFVCMTAGSDKGWKGRFVYVKTDTLKCDVSYLQNNWNVLEGITYPAATAAGKDTIKLFCRLPKEERTFSLALNSEINAVVISAEAVDCEDTSSMSTGTVNPGKRSLTPRELVERFKRKRCVSGGLTIMPASAVNVSMHSPPVISHSSERPKFAFNAPVASMGGKSTLLEFPEGFGGVYDEGMWPHLQKLKIGGALAVFENKSPNEVAKDTAVSCFKGLQGSLHLASIVDQSQRKLTVVEDEKKELSCALSKATDEQGRLQKTNELLDSKLKEIKERELQLERANIDLVAGLKDCEARLKECSEKLVIKKRKLINCASYYSHLARVECMEEHGRGASADWDVNAERKALEETYHEKPSLSMSDNEELDYEDVSSKEDAQAVLPVETVDVAPIAVVKNGTDEEEDAMEIPEATPGDVLTQ